MQSEQLAARALGVYATTTDEAKALVPRANTRRYLKPVLDVHLG
jgi:hypothetical protein